MALGLFFVSFFMYFLYHVARFVISTPVVKCRIFCPSCTEYMANLVSRRRTETISCSSDWLIVAKDSGTTQLENPVMIPKKIVYHARSLEVYP